jgi:hypothetical protein
MMFIVEKLEKKLIHRPPNAVSYDGSWHFVRQGNNLLQEMRNMSSLFDHNSPYQQEVRILDGYSGKMLISAKSFDTSPMTQLQDAVILNRI